MGGRNHPLCNCMGAMEMFSMLKQSLTTEGVNPITKYFEIGRQVASAGPEMVWKIHEAVRIEDKRPASIFVFEKRVADKLHKPRRRETVAEILRREVRQLEHIRHPKILHILHKVEECHDSLAFATEPVMASLANLLGSHERLPNPVPTHLKDHEFLEVEVRYGILQITEALSYLHGTEQMLHGNVCPSSIIITKRGCWKLGGLGFSEKARDGKESLPGQPWTSKCPKMAQPDLDYMAPEIQLDKSSTMLSDLFSLGMVICAIYNNGKSLIDASHMPGVYCKRIEQLNEYFSDVAHKIPLPLVEPVEKMIHRDVRYRPTAQLLSLLKYFNDPVVAIIQQLDLLDHMDSNDRADVHSNLMQVIPSIPKKVIYQRIFPILREECRSQDTICLALPSLITLIDCASREEFIDRLFPALRTLLCQPKPIQATAYLLDKLDIILSKTPKEDIKTEILPLVFNTLDGNSIQGQEAALNSIGIIREYLDENVMKKMVLPRAKGLFYKSTNVKIRLTALTCIDKLLDSLDKMIILDEVLPFLTEISCQDPDLVMVIVGIYKHMLSDKKFGLTHNLIATKVMPPLIPHTVNPGLSMEQFGALMEVLRDMLENIDRQRRNKMKQQEHISVAAQRGSIKMRQGFGGPDDKYNMDDKVRSHHGLLGVEDVMMMKCRTGWYTSPSTPELQQRPKMMSPKSQRKNNSLMSLGSSLVNSGQNDEKSSILDRPQEVLRRYSLVPPGQGTPAIGLIPDSNCNDTSDRPRRPSTQSLGPLTVPGEGENQTRRASTHSLGPVIIPLPSLESVESLVPDQERRSSRSGSIFGTLGADMNRRPSFTSLGETVMQLFSGK